MVTWVVSSIAVSLLALACGGATETPNTKDTASTPGGPSSSGGSATNAGRAADAPGAAASSPPAKTGVPDKVRATSVACTGTRPPAEQADPNPADTCTDDAECTSGLDGRCSYLFSGHKSCTYSACRSDADCGGMAVCGCGLGIDKANVCLTNSECRTSSDCAAGQYCVLSALPGVPIGDGSVTFYGQAWGYFCTTSQDRCRSESDCASQPHDHSCVYYTTLKSWGCGGGP